MPFDVRFELKTPNCRAGPTLQLPPKVTWDRRVFPKRAPGRSQLTGRTSPTTCRCDAEPGVTKGHPARLRSRERPRVRVEIIGVSCASIQTVSRKFFESLGHILNGWSSVAASYRLLRVSGDFVVYLLDDANAVSDLLECLAPSVRWF